MHIEDLIIYGVCVLVVGGILTVLWFPSTMPPQKTQLTPTPEIKLQPTPQIIPTVWRTPFPRITPTPTPTPTPIPPRWCDENGKCFFGTPPTPIPTPTPIPVTPTPTPTPTPNPCDPALAPAELRWQYFNPCTCNIRKTFGLGPYFSVAEACHTQVAWKEESCACLKLLVQGG